MWTWHRFFVTAYVSREFEVDTDFDKTSGKREVIAHNWRHVYDKGHNWHNTQITNRKEKKKKNFVLCLPNSVKSLCTRMKLYTPLDK